MGVSCGHLHFPTISYDWQEQLAVLRQLSSATPTTWPTSSKWSLSSWAWRARRRCKWCPCSTPPGSRPWWRPSTMVAPVSPCLPSTLVIYHLIISGLQEIICFDDDWEIPVPDISIVLARHLPGSPAQAPATTPGNGAASCPVPCEKPQRHTKAFRKFGKGFSQS